MAQARKYAINENAFSGRGKKYFSTIKGQAKIVADDLFANREPRLAVEITKNCGAKIVTKQDTHRVVLYYVIIFKTRGFVSAFDVENVVEEMTEKTQEEITAE